MTSLVSCLLLGACGGHYSRLPGQDEAQYLIWEATYSETRFPAPPTEWEMTLDCNGGTMAMISGECLMGQYNSPPEDYLQLANYDRFSDGSYAHELYHAWLTYHTGDGDFNHAGAGWAKGGIVDQANAALAIADL